MWIEVIYVKLKRVDELKMTGRSVVDGVITMRMGSALKTIVSVEETAPVWKVAEEGHLSETLEEFFGSVKLEEFRELEYKLREWKVSEKRIKEFKDLFKQCYDQWVLDHKDELDNTIDRCYQNHLADEVDDGVYINDPEEYCCKEWC